MAYIDTLNASAQILRRTSSTANGMGPANDTGPFTPVLINGQPLTVPVRVAQQSQRVRAHASSGDKDATVESLTIFTMYDTRIQSRDRFIVQGQKYDTFDVNDPGLTHDHLEFAAKKVD